MKPGFFPITQQLPNARLKQFWETLPEPGIDTRPAACLARIRAVLNELSYFTPHQQDELVFAAFEDLDRLEEFHGDG